MRKSSMVLLLAACPLWADAPKVTPDKADVQPGGWFLLKVERAKGDEAKTLAIASPGGLILWPHPTEAGQFMAMVPPTMTGPQSLQFWWAGDTVTLPKSGPLPSLPVSVVQVQVGPVVPPKPPTPPEPKPDENVIPTKALSVLIVEESGERTKLSAGQLKAMFAESVDAYVKAKGGAMRILDKDDDVSAESAFFKAAFARAAGKATPFLIVGNGKKQYEGPLVNDDVEMLNLLKQYGE